MQRISILALDHAITFSVMGTMDIFSQVGVTYNFVTGAAAQPRFDVEIVTLDGRSVNGFNQTRIYPHRSAAEVQATDLIIIASYIDLAVYLIERFHGSTVALQSSKAMLHHFSRTSQTPYIVYQPRKDHGDVKILAIQERMERSYNQEFDADLIARSNGMSRRTFERRFKSATGDTPLAYLQRTWVEAAKQLLESGLQT